MATTAVTLNGTTYFVPQPGERGVTYDQDLTNYLIALATAFPQGGTSPSSTFQALISAGANPASAGRIRLAFADLFEWRNFANTGNVILELVNGGATNGDNLAFVDTSGNTNLLTGRAYAEFSTTAAPSMANGAGTVVNYATLVADTDSAVTTGAAWHFTVPAGKGGRYLVSAVATLTGLTVDTGLIAMSVAKNATNIASGYQTTAKNGTTLGLTVTAEIMCVPGDQLNAVLFQNNGGARTLSVNAPENRITIQGPF